MDEPKKCPHGFPAVIQDLGDGWKRVVGGVVVGGPFDGNPCRLCEADGFVGLAWKDFDHDLTHEELRKMLGGS